MDFQTRYLRYFLAVADERSFSRAAQRLRVSQPSLSQRIQGLEKQIGFPLFLRAGRKVELTDRGKALVESVRGLIGYASRVDRLVNDLRLQREGPLQIGASIYSDFPERTALFAAFMAEYPQEEIELETAYTLALFDGLLEGAFDLAVITGPLPDPQRFQTLVMRWFPVEVIVPAASPLASAREVTLEMLNGVSLAGFRRKRHPQLFDQLIQPLVNHGANLAFPPDQSPAGTLAFAARRDMITVTSFIQHSDEDVHAAKMVRRSLKDMAPVAALILVRAKDGPTGPSDPLWRFAEKWITAH